MPTLDQLKAQRDAILTEMGGEQRVEFGGRAVTLRPQDELEAALRLVDAEIAKLQAPQPRRFTIRTGRGL